MTFDAHAYHVKNSLLSNYAASPNILNTTMWQHTNTGLEVVDPSNELPLKIFIVGRISTFRLKSGPAGNHMKNGFGSLDKAKYQFHMSRPADAELASDYNVAIANLETLQHQVATTTDIRNMVITDVTGKMIRFVRNVFTLRENAVPDSPHGQAAKNAVQMDEETKNWPIPDEFATEMDAIKYTFRADHLPVFYEGNPIMAVDVNDILNGAIVEVQFTMRHWRIQAYDSFQATPQKITVLRLGPYHHKSDYKRANPNDSPDEPQAKKVHLNATASTSKA
ncbi:hypothetical protein EDD22DRAFT_954597 [Suillus occidentalis]|nr:hypothetical protein EDD22DRAFT_954597 [Suillus occidentalis]